MTVHGSIRNLADFKRYSPPGHTGTRNLRLVEKDFCGAFEMIHGTIDPGCGAERHSHETEAQVCYVLEGEMEVTFDEGPPVRCGPGAVVEIPPGVDHLIINCGAAPLQLLVIYSPPLAPRGDTPIDG